MSSQVTPCGIVKIVSGGQSGVDRAALDWAIDHEVAHGGWCPRGRRAEDGAIDQRYSLVETSSRDYTQRTRKNIECSDGTLIVNIGTLAGGSALTASHARQSGRPLLILQLEDPAAGSRERFIEWVKHHSIKTLNVAGPRESKHPGIYEDAKRLLKHVLE